MPKHKLTPDDSRKGAQAAAEAKRRKREEERALLTEARQEHLDVAIGRLSRAAETAAQAITKLLEARSESVRLRAAEDVIEILLDATVLDMATRLDRLERTARNGRSR